MGNGNNTPPPPPPPPKCVQCESDFMVSIRCCKKLCLLCFEKALKFRGSQSTFSCCRTIRQIKPTFAFIGRQNSGKTQFYTTFDNRPYKKTLANKYDSYIHQVGKYYIYDYEGVSKTNPLAYSYLKQLISYNLFFAIFFSYRHLDSLNLAKKNIKLLLENGINKNRIMFICTHTDFATKQFSKSNIIDQISPFEIQFYQINTLKIQDVNRVYSKMSQFGLDLADNQERRFSVVGKFSNRLEQKIKNIKGCFFQFHMLDQEAQSWFNIPINKANYIIVHEKGNQKLIGKIILRLNRDQNKKNITIILEDDGHKNSVLENEITEYEKFDFPLEWANMKSHLKFVE